MKTFILIALSLILVSCTGKHGGAELHSAKDMSSFEKFINNKSMPKNPNLTIDKSVINEDYPIEIALYENQKFFYNLPNLGTGTGKWKYSDGKIELRAKRTLFDMYIEVYGSSADFTGLAIQFTDRFGPNSLKMDNNNIQ